MARSRVPRLRAGGGCIHDVAPPQMGNAVAPPVAAALGRCLLLAAAGAAPVGAAVVSVPDEEYEAVARACTAQGVRSWVEDNGVPEVGPGFLGGGRGVL